MNYLAHIYLSGDNDQLKIGNFIADSVKGKKYIHYPKHIQEGIILHRAIDNFTDVHSTVFKSKHRLFDRYGHYSSVIVDVLYDHFLAKNWQDYHPTPLADYIADFYVLLNDNFDILPKKVQNFLPFMLRDNWLLSYAEISGIQRILFQMNHRVVNDVQLHHSVKELKQYYTEFEDEFTFFFAELIAFVKKSRNKLVD